VGTIYKQQSAFEAKRVGAPIAARNIAAAIESRFAGRPRDWSPLVYCWRGGGRSGAMVHLLRQVGWNARRLEGGYKAFRRQVVTDLDALPKRFRYHVICGATGSGKSRLLEALVAAGAQVLDLEVLAQHRGSVLGDLPDEPQPTQKRFETELWDALSRFDPKRPVYVESESKKVGNLRVPDELIQRMRAARCFRLEAAEDVRVALLMEDYAHFVASPEALMAKLGLLRDLHGEGRIAQWELHAREGRVAAAGSRPAGEPLRPGVSQVAAAQLSRCASAQVVEVREAAARAFSHWRGPWCASTDSPVRAHSV
jgi:tRNA 2-selenouridine synthase